MNLQGDIGPDLPVALKSFVVAGAEAAVDGRPVTAVDRADRCARWRRRCGGDCPVREGDATGWATAGAERDVGLDSTGAKQSEQMRMTQPARFSDPRAAGDSAITYTS